MKKKKQKKLLIQVCGFVSIFLTLFLMADEFMLILYSSMSYFEARKITMDRDLKAIEEEFGNESNVLEGFHDSHMKDFRYDCIYLLEVEQNGETSVVLKGVNDDEDFVKSPDEKPYIDFNNSLNLKEIVNEKTDDTKCEILLKNGELWDKVCVGLRCLSSNGSVSYVLCVIDDMTQFEETMNNMIAPTLVSRIILIILNNILLLGFLYFTSIKPVTMIQKSVCEYSETKDTVKITDRLSRIKSNNEFGALASDISHLANEIERYTGENIEFAKEKQRALTELETAARIQLSQLPGNFPYFSDRKEFEIYASMTPAKEVGGDFYDFFLIDDDHLAMVIADVSGKGVPAALFMMSAKMLIKTCSSYGSTPAEIIKDVNERICENNEEAMFVTIWLGILQISTGRLTGCNAGHEFPAVKCASGEFGLLKEKHGMAVGLISGAEYVDYEIVFDPGDMLFVYTDGIPEAFNEAQEQFGNKRLLKTINSVSEKPLKEMLEDVQKTVDDFSKGMPQSDDLTMLAFKYNGLRAPALFGNCSEDEEF